MENKLWIAIALILKDIKITKWLGFRRLNKIQFERSASKKWEKYQNREVVKETVKSTKEWVAFKLTLS